ncbi:hypothetical protein ACQW02_07910 [Humitalea sp. 24SJ18S-53]|uniref:hypothetical protein n=1 Tax=Humitalea sp. 24SJ18S-53 TaxID=3422307 RepID=UPI003D671925
MRRIFAALLALGAMIAPAQAQPARHWVTSWAASVQGPYPIGNPSAQPDQRFAFPTPATGANDQSLRLIIRPSIWGREARLRFTNALGTQPLTLDGVFVGLQQGGATVMPGTNQPVRFGGEARVTIPPGGQAWSDPVALPFAPIPTMPCCQAGNWRSACMWWAPAGR